VWVESLDLSIARYVFSSPPNHLRIGLLSRKIHGLCGRTSQPQRRYFLNLTPKRQIHNKLQLLFCSCLGRHEARFDTVMICKTTQNSKQIKSGACLFPSLILRGSVFAVWPTRRVSFLRHSPQLTPTQRYRYPAIGGCYWK
jgi:hypothetical protein